MKMKKRLRSYLAMILTLSLVFGCMGGFVTVSAETAGVQNSLKETMTVSETEENVNLALNKPVTVSSLEVNWLTAEMMVDGIFGVNSRWSPSPSDTNASVVIDLGEVTQVSEIDISFWRSSPEYKIMISEDGENYETVLHRTGVTSDEYLRQSIDIITFEPKMAQYVRFEQVQRRPEGGQLWGCTIEEIEVYREAIENTNLALHKAVTVSSLEVAGMLTGDMAVDGVSAVTSRWSPSPNDVNASLMVDLGKAEKVSEIIVDFWRSSPEYKVMVSLDGKTYETVLHRTQVPSTEYLNTSKDIISFPTKNVRYVKFEQIQQRPENNKLWGSTIAEIEVYREMSFETASSWLTGIKDQLPVLSEDMTQLIFPEIQSDEYEVQLYSSSNEAVIGLDGSVTQPLQDMTVAFTYQVVNKNKEGDKAVATNELSIVVPGRYAAEPGDNERPNVLPEIREWKGHKGKVILTESSRIVYDDDTIAETAAQVAYYFAEMLDSAIKAEKGTPVDGDIYLTISDKAELGEEGYLLTIDDIVTVEAYKAKGILYGGTTLTQMLFQEESHSILPKGIIRDYPQFEVRSCMIDVGRIYIPIEYLEEITKYMAYYKINEIHVHISDDNGEATYSGVPYPSAFRLESEKYPEINNAEYYTKDEYRDYQKEVAKYGIKVVTEIDTPAHSGWVNFYNTDYMLDATHIDVTNREAIDFIKSLLDEYLDGEDPVIQSDTFNIGTDEYSGHSQYREQFASYMNEMIAYLNEKGYDVRFWANGETGNYDIDRNATVNMWCPGSKWYNNGNPLINNYRQKLYLVPGVGGYPVYYDLASLYNNWEVNIFEDAVLNISDPRLLGAESAIWYDFKIGTSQIDYFHRIQGQVMLMAEKNWYGPKTDGQTSEDFLNRVNALSDYAPGANPLRYVKNIDEAVAGYDFESVDGTVVKDSSLNQYDGILNHAKVIEKQGNKVLALEGDGCLKLPFDTLGFPYTAEFDLYIDADTPANAKIFDGKDGTMYLNYDNLGKIGYERKGYTYIVDYEYETDCWQHVTISCDDKNIYLYINGEYAGSGEYYNVAANKQDSATFALTCEAIGSGVIGYMDNIVLYDTNALASDNLAYKKSVTVSSLEVQDGRLTGEMAVDGVNSVTSRWSPATNDTQAWLVVDLGDVIDMNKIVLDIYQECTQWQVFISEDGESWEMIHEELEGENGRQNIVREFSFDTKQARYVKYQQLTGVWNEQHKQYFGSSIAELEVYHQVDTVDHVLEELINAVEAIDTSIYTSDSVEKLQKALMLAKEVQADKHAIKIVQDEAIYELKNAIEELKYVFQILEQPEDAVAEKGTDAVVTVKAIGEGLSYKWYYKNPGNVKFYDSGTQFVSEDGAAYTIPMAAWRDGQEVYCVITDAEGNTLQTNTVTLSMYKGSIRIVKQPEDVVVETMGEEAVVTVEATGKGLRYEWYYKNPGNVKFYVSGDDFVSEDGTTYTIPVARWRDGQEVFCVITDANGISVQTNTVALSVAK